MKLETKKINQMNSLLLVIFMFGGSLTLPLKDLVNGGTPIWILTIFIIVTSLYVNSLRINYKVLIAIMTMIFIFILNSYFVDYKGIVFEVLIEFIKFGIIPLYLASYIKDFESLLRYWYITGILNVVIWVFYFDSINNAELSYMSYGTYMTFSFIIFAIYYYNNRRKNLSLFMMLVAFILIAALANRSVVLICGIIIIYFELKSIKYNNPIYTIIKMTIYFVSIYLFVNNINYILLKLQNVLLNLGISSYSLHKVIYTINYGLANASSGRDIIYNDAINMITENYFLPKGVGYYQFQTGIAYPHNLFLDLLVTFGFLGIILFVVLLFLFIKDYFNIKIPIISSIIGSLFLFFFVRLMFSGTFWTETALWILIGLLFSFSKMDSKKLVEVN